MEYNQWMKHTQGLDKGNGSSLPSIPWPVPILISSSSGSGSLGRLGQAFWISKLLNPPGGWVLCGCWPSNPLAPRPLLLMVMLCLMTSSSLPWWRRRTGSDEATGTRCYKHHIKHCMLFWFDFCVNHRTETPKTRQIHHYLSIVEIPSPIYNVDDDLMDIFVVEEMSCKLSLHSEWPNSVKLHFKGTLIGFDRKVHNQEVWWECDMMGGKVMGAVVGKIRIWCSSGVWKLKALTLTWITLTVTWPEAGLRAGSWAWQQQ